MFSQLIIVQTNDLQIPMKSLLFSRMLCCKSLKRCTNKYGQVHQKLHLIQSKFRHHTREGKISTYEAFWLKRELLLCIIELICIDGCVFYSSFYLFFLFSFTVKKNLLISKPLQDYKHNTFTLCLHTKTIPQSNWLIIEVIVAFSLEEQLSLLYAYIKIAFVIEKIMTCYSHYLNLLTKIYTSQRSCSGKNTNAKANTPSSCAHVK